MKVNETALLQESQRLKDLCALLIDTTRSIIDDSKRDQDARRAETEDGAARIEESLRDRDRAHADSANVKSSRLQESAAEPVSCRPPFGFAEHAVE
jgi:hypothetical protein